MSDLPTGWIRAKVGEIADSVQSGFASGDHNRAGVGIPHLRPMNIGRDGRLILENLRYVRDSEGHRLRRGDVLFNNTNSAELVGKTTWIDIDRDLAFSNHMTRVRVPKGVSPEFVARQLHHLWSRGVFELLCNNHVSQASVSARTLSDEVGLRLPPAAEQKRIVAKIEELTARSRRAKEALDAVPPLLDKLRQSILAAAFRGDLTADWRAKNPNVEPADKLIARIRAERRARWEAAELAKLAAKGKRPVDDRWKGKYVDPSVLDEGTLPDLPLGWCWVPLPLLGELARGKSKHRPRNDPALFGSSAPFIQTGEVARSGGRIREYSTMYSDFGVSQSRLFPKGTLCITIAANIADTGILEFEACFPDSVVGFIADGGEKVASYVELFVRTARADLQRFAPATAQANINLEILGQVAVAIPPSGELQLLVERVEQAMACVERTADGWESARLRLETLEQSVLAKAFRGELVPQDSDDEPISVLLDRIRSARNGAKTGRARRRPRKVEGVAEEPDKADNDDVGDGPSPPLRRTPGRKATKDLSELDPDVVHDEVFAALWTRGSLEQEDAVHQVAGHFREAGYVEFQRLRAKESLYDRCLEFIEAAFKAGRLDRPKRGQVRACKADASAFTADDWRFALVASLGSEPVDRDEAIQVAADWARDNLGLEFSRLRSDGPIVEGLRSAINSAIRRGELVRHDTTRIARAGSGHQHSLPGVSVTELKGDGRQRRASESRDV